MFTDKNLPKGLLDAASAMLEGNFVRVEGNRASVVTREGKVLKTFDRADHGTNYKKLAYEYRTAKEEVEIDEKMDMKKADMGDVIKDFQKSDAPQFKGKSDAKKREMAVAAKLAAEAKKMDPVGQEDGDIDNDGDKDSSDKYLHNRRKAIKKAMKESTELDESHFKVGDEVKCKASGMEGEVVAVDPEEKGKYYTVKREDGKTMKYAPDELMKDSDDEDEMKEEVEQVDEISQKLALNYASKASDARGHKGMPTKKVDKRYDGVALANKKMVGKAAVPATEATENAPSKENGGIAHQCATHVKHATYGEGRCIPGMHDIIETEEGLGYVSHYDVMFEGEQGPFIVTDCPVEELEIVQEMSHGHKRKK